MDDLRLFTKVEATIRPEPDLYRLSEKGLSGRRVLARLPERLDIPELPDIPELALEGRVTSPRHQCHLRKSNEVTTLKDYDRQAIKLYTKASVK